VVQLIRQHSATSLPRILRRSLPNRRG